MDDKLLRIPQVAEMTGFSVATIRAWRQQGRGPKSGRLAGAVVYRESDVRSWIDSQLAAADGSPAA